MLEVVLYVSWPETGCMVQSSLITFATMTNIEMSVSTKPSIRAWLISTPMENFTTFCFVDAYSPNNSCRYNNNHLILGYLTSFLFLANLIMDLQGTLIHQEQSKWFPWVLKDFFLLQNVTRFLTWCSHQFQLLCFCPQVFLLIFCQMSMLVHVISS